MWKKIKNFLVGFFAFITPFLTPFNFIFNILKIDKLIIIYYIFAIILLIYAILNLSDNRAIKRRGLESKATQTTRLALNPESEAKRVLKFCKLLRKVGKAMIKFLKTYKGIILATLIFIITCIDQFTGIFGNVCVVDGVNILQVVGYGLSSIVAAISYGFGSPQFKEAIQNLKTSLQKENNVTDNPEKAVKYVKSLISTSEKELTSLENNYNKALKSLESEYSKVISEYQMSTSLNLVVSETISQGYNDYQTKLAELQSEFNKQISEKQALIASYKSKLEEITPKLA